MSEIVILAERRKEPQEPAGVMAEVTIFSDGEGTIWVSDNLVTTEQFNWLMAQLADIAHTALLIKGERTGKI
jgi:hypothetical protein